MCSNINDCCRLRTGPEWCRLTNECPGWGCRLLTIIPDSIPTTTNERAKLFSRVYRLAERIGVLSCPNFKERALDSMVEDDSLLLSMRKSVQNLHI